MEVDQWQSLVEQSGGSSSNAACSGEQGKPSGAKPCPPVHATISYCLYPEKVGIKTMPGKPELRAPLHQGPKGFAVADFGEGDEATECTNLLLVVKPVPKKKEGEGERGEKKKRGRPVKKRPAAAPAPAPVDHGEAPPPIQDGEALGPQEIMPEQPVVAVKVVPEQQVVAVEVVPELQVVAQERAEDSEPPPKRPKKQDLVVFLMFFQACIFYDSYF